MRILVTVKTYPVLSESHIELVCTAGLNENGEWIRLYPIPFRASINFEQYSKFDWIECAVERNIKDFRKESYRPIDHHRIKKISNIGTTDNWRLRNEIVLGNTEIYTDMSKLVSEAQDRLISLAVFQPKEIINLRIVEAEHEYDQAKIDIIKGKLAENDLFEDNTWKANFDFVKKLPYRFIYRFLDKDGKQHNMSILDWEIGALFWKVSQYNPAKYEEAKDKVYQKYFEYFRTRDIYFFLGTTLEYHKRSHNPFTIVGVYYPPKTEPTLFDN